MHNAYLLYLKRSQVNSLCSVSDTIPNLTVWILHYAIQISFLCIWLHYFSNSKIKQRDDRKCIVYLSFGVLGNYHYKTFVRPQPLLCMLCSRNGQECFRVIFKHFIVTFCLYFSSLVTMGELFNSDRGTLGIVFLMEEERQKGNVKAPLLFPDLHCFAPRQFP